MQDKIKRLLEKHGYGKFAELVEIPKDSSLGDYSLPCFSLAKKFRKNPVEIAKDIAFRIGKTGGFEKIEAVNGYVNFFADGKRLAKDVLEKIKKDRDKFGSWSLGNGKKIVVEMSSPNIAKPFGIGHLRSTIIGNSISKICEFQGFKTVKINYLGDWGTQFGKMIVGYKKFGKEKELRKNPVDYMLKLYVKGNDEEFEEEARNWFKKLEDGDKEAVRLWKMFRKMSLKNFEEIYNLLGIKFDLISGESFYNKKMKKVINDLKKSKLLEESEGAFVVNLEKYNLGVTLIQKSDGATLYITRDLAAAIDRYEKFKFNRMIYEVGQEQKLHFKQLFKILELMGEEWAKNCVHVEHGLYLDKDGKKFATRKGKIVYMKDILDETINLAKAEIKKRSKNVSGKEVEERASKIAAAAIFYGDLKNYRGSDMVFDVKRFLSFEGDTGPYLLYSYARAKSILRKSRYKKRKKFEIKEVNENEKRLVSELERFEDVVRNAYENLAPNLIANYAFSLAQAFNEFYHSSQVIGSEEEQFRLRLVESFAQVLKNALGLLGISVIEEM